MLNGCYSQAVSTAFMRLWNVSVDSTVTLWEGASQTLSSGKPQPVSCSWRFSVRGGNANFAFKMAQKSLENTQLNICRTYIKFTLKMHSKCCLISFTRGTYQSQIHGVGKYLVDARAWGVGGGDAR